MKYTLSHTIALAAFGALFSSHALAVETITIDGSSTVFPITEAVAEEFQKKTQTRVTVGISGTGGGFKKFCRGETDISDASRPISKDEMELCKQNGVKYFELPIAFDALTVVVNPKNTWAKSMTVAELKTMWEPAAQGKVMNWSQVRQGWPDQKMTLYGAGSDSGTFDYFTEATVGKAKSSRGDYTGSEDDNVLVQGISKDVNAIGYVPYSYYVAQKGALNAVGIDGGKGPVLPSTENVVNGTYTPLSRPLFIYVSEKSTARPEVKDFVNFYLTTGQKLVSEVKYLAFAPSVYESVAKRFTSGESGTAFGGVAEVGLHVEEILKRKPVH